MQLARQAAGAWPGLQRRSSTLRAGYHLAGSTADGVLGVCLSREPCREHTTMLSKATGLPAPEYLGVRDELDLPR